MMAEYIEREAALAAINALRGPHAMPKICIEKIPAADVAEVRHGRWLDGRCTVCAWEAPDECAYDGYENIVLEETPYCPNCGAKMDGAQPETGETEQEE